MYCLVQCKSPGVLPGTPRPTLPPTDHSTGRVPSTGPDIPDLSTGAFSAFSLLSAFGQAVPLNLELQRRGRILPFPFHFLDNTKAMNVYPKHYSCPEFHQHVVDLSLYAFSWPRIFRRLQANRGVIPKRMNVLRAVSSEGFGRIKSHSTIRRLLDTDPAVRGFLEGETSVLPKFYEHRIQRFLGPLWEALPPHALMHDPNAYLTVAQTPDSISI